MLSVDHRIYKLLFSHTFPFILSLFYFFFTIANFTSTYAGLITPAEDSYAGHL